MREPLSHRSPPPQHRGRLRATTAAATAVVLLAAAALLYLYFPDDAADPEPAVSGVTVPRPAESAPAPPRPAPRAAEPLEREPSPTETPPPEPLPPLDDSDEDLVSALVERLGPDAAGGWLKPEAIVRNIVVTIDNLPRDQVSLERRPFTPAPGEPVTAGDDDAPVLTADNFERYVPFVEHVAALDMDAVVDLYTRYRPLFVEAYRELGYPDGDFDARLVEVIDHLLEAPAIEPPIPLVQPGLLYEFADEALEQRSAGHKILIRMGPANAMAIKARLRELRRTLVERQLAPPAQSLDDALPPPALTR